MLGLKFFVPVQTFWRRPFAASRNFCHPGVIFSVRKIRSVYLVAELIRKFSGWLVFFFSVGFCLGSLCLISVSWSRECLVATFRNCCKKLPFHADIWPKMPVLGQIWPFLGPKSNFWGQGVKILVPSYRDSNETPFSCSKHRSLRLQLAARGENVLFWPQNLDIWGQKSIFCLVIAIFVDGTNDHYTRG